VSSTYQQAIDAGYTPEEINSFLSKKDPRYQKALDAGYKPEEITEFLSKSKEPKESLLANVGRQAGRTGARVAETVLGAPRALGEFGEMLIPEKLIKKGAEKVGLKEPVEKGFEFAKKYAPYKLFPSSEQVREFNKDIFGTKLEPKNEWEAKADEAISDFTALTLPLPGSKFKVLKPAMLALGGNVAKEIVGRMGGSEKEQTYTKLGTIFAGSLINPKSAQKLATDLYSNAKAARPIDAKVSAQNLERSVDSLEKQLMKGDPSATSKRKTLDLIKDLKSKIQNNDIEIEELEQFKRDINEARSGLYENFKTDKVGRKAAKRNLDTVSKFVDNSLKEYGRQNPQWEAFYRPANEVHGAIAQSRRVRNYIERIAKKYGMHAILPALGIGHFGGIAGITGAAGTAAVGGAALLGGEIAVKLAKSPTLRKHYMNLINSAVKEDAVAVQRNLELLKKEMDKEKD
jgi:hypothetical protein